MPLYKSTKLRPLDKNRQQVICTYLQKVYNESIKSTKRNRLPMEYLDKIFSQNEIFCWKCEKIIEIGSMYNSSTGSNNGSIKKYYHRECYEKMFY